MPDGHVWLRITRPQYADPFDPSFAQRRGGRWNPPDSWPTLYLNQDLATVHAQVRHLFAGRGIEPDDLDDDAPIRLAAATLPGRQRAADVLSDDGVGAVGLPASVPARRAGPTRCARDNTSDRCQRPPGRTPWRVVPVSSRRRPRVRLVPGGALEGAPGLAGAPRVRSVASRRVPRPTADVTVLLDFCASYSYRSSREGVRTERTRSVLTAARSTIHATSPIQIPAMPSDGVASTATAIGTTARRYPNAARPRNR